MWKYIRSLNNRQNEFKTISDTSAPIIYNTNNNIHIWLAQIEDYLDAKQIKTDKQKQLVLDRLDKTSRQLISDLVKQNKKLSANGRSSNVQMTTF